MIGEGIQTLAEPVRSAMYIANRSLDIFESISCIMQNNISVNDVVTATAKDANSEST